MMYTSIDKYIWINKISRYPFYLLIHLKMKNRQFFILLTVIIVLSCIFYSKLNTLERIESVNRNIDTNVAHMYDDINDKMEDMQYSIDEILNTVYGL